jgi:hypothetical protein
VTLCAISDQSAAHKAFVVCGVTPLPTSVMNLRYLWKTAQNIMEPYERRGTARNFMEQMEK